MHSNIFISQIILNNFRSHKNFSINTNSKNIVLHGENGAGKTNILESVSLLSPGRGLRNAKSEEIIKAGIAQIPVGRIGTPEDMAHAYLFLASKEAGFISGHTLHANGGAMPN